MSEPTTIVIPTLARPSLDALLTALAGQSIPVTASIILVDDRRDPGETPPSAIEPPTGADLDITVVSGRGLGPAHARNVGWRHARTPWISFLDDDVLPDAEWYASLLTDLEAAEQAGAAGSTARVHVPLPPDRRPTDWERGTAGLATARWITADLSYRRAALAAVGGFDERFPRAFREDADLALRITEDLGAVIVEGERRITHPVRPSDDWASLRQQAGNADDMLMARVHGADWHDRAGEHVGRRPRHVVITAAGVLAVGGALARRGALAAVGATIWAAGTAEFAWRRIAPGPRDSDEVRRMLLTSMAIPPAATWHTARGLVEHRHAGRWRGLPELVLLDRDGTLIRDVPYNGDPARVVPMPGARRALDRLRAEGVRLAVVSNQSGVARGLITPAQVEAVNARVAELLGPFEAFYVCEHGPDDGCSCRKPQPGLVKQALAEAGVVPDRALLIGDIGSDVEAAAAAGVRAVLVPTPVTRAEEIAAASHVARTLAEAVGSVLGATTEKATR
ncbi:HAD-IIIA family hydrolase [Nocardioides sp. BP30]|uniref:HAD-IIIA family hydrolase n=1 Tax=Nocardioides sp. BP30 TaxID=3036374 RepID=UPI0024690B79|nr:HAD-IIIA family hydrolase [Nocardioides sp. BP30]WGL53007.1 HAD-IIIA family hydrolase [Nocardioides sp. BP30]